jgi:hypothetical protein
MMEKAMKRVILAILLIVPALASAQYLTSADYNVDVHVRSSRLVYLCPRTCSMFQHLSVLIDGKKYEIEDEKSRSDLLRIGDYKAKISKDETTRAYEYKRAYEFLFPDGQTRRYDVVDEGE